MAEVKEVKDVLESYPLSRDFVDFNRHHYLWKDVFGYNIHPKIHQGRELMKVADVGAGTGVWLMDVLPQLHPDAQLVGVDTDTSQLAPEQWLPPRVTVREWDVFTEVPEDLVGAFDMVNLRLFNFVIVDDPAPVLRNLIKMLKPGGYIQWGEVNVPSMRIETATSGLETTCLQSLWDETIPPGSRMRPEWAKALPETFAREGLLNVEADWQRGKDHTALAIHWCNLHIHQMMADRLRPANAEKAAQLDRLVLGAAAESRRGAMYAFDKVTVIGQKSAY
ncbi:hypothetical protein PG995_006103 [Apiospora arundinis]